MYEVVLVKNECFRDNQPVYKSKIKLQKNSKTIQSVKYNRQSHQLGENQCKFPYSKSYVLGFFNVPFSFGSNTYDVIIDVESDLELDTNDSIIIRQSLYF